MTLVSSLRSMAANVWNYFSIPSDPLWQRAMDEAGYREYLAFESSVQANLKSVEEHISNKTILPHTLRTILLKQQEQLERFISPYFYDKKLKRLQNKLDCPKPFIDVIKESRARLKEKLAENSLITKQSFYNDVINHLIKLSANLDLLVVNADDLADVIQYYQGIIPAEIFDPIKAAIENNPITDQKNIEVVLKTVNAFFFGDKTEKFSVVSNSVAQFQSRSPNLKQLLAALAWSYVGGEMGVRAQPTGIEFLKIFGGTSNDYGRDIMMIPTNEIIVGGITGSFGAGFSDGLLAKYSLNSSPVWIQRFGGNDHDHIYKISMTPTGEIVAAGNTRSVGAGGVDIWQTKFSLNGEVIWAEALGGNFVDYFEDMFLNPQGEIFIVGYTQNFGARGEKSLVVKLDPNGPPIWSRMLGGNSSDYGRAGAVDPNSGMIGVLSDTRSFGAVEMNILITILNVNGTLHCACTLGGSENDYGRDIKWSPNGDIVILGYTENFGTGSGGAWIASLSGNCKVNWVRTYEMVAQSMIVAPTTGNILLLGGSSSFGQPSLLINLFANGMLDWAETFGTSGYYNYAFTVTSNDEIFTIGSTSSYDILFSKLSSHQNSSVCGAVTPVNLTVMDWTNITVKNVTLEINITSPTLSVYNWTDMPVQAITPEEYFSCPNNSMATTSSNLLSESTVSSTSQNSQINTATGPSSSSNNPTSSRTSQASNTINFTVRVSPEIILIESEGDPIIILSSTHLSVIGDVDLSNVIYTVSGNMPDWVTIYVDGVMVTQFTQEDVEGGFVSFQLNGVPCGDQYSLPLKVNGADVDADLIFQMDTCSTDNAPRLISDGLLISSKMLPIFGFLARTREQPMRSPECSEAELGRGFQLP